MDATRQTADASGRTPYEAPAIVDYGSLADITAGSLSGDFIDKSFPVNTPAKDLTFS